MAQGLHVLAMCDTLVWGGCFWMRTGCFCRVFSVDVLWTLLALLHWARN